MSDFRKAVEALAVKWMNEVGVNAFCVRELFELLARFPEQKPADVGAAQPVGRVCWHMHFGDVQHAYYAHWSASYKPKPGDELYLSPPIVATNEIGWLVENGGTAISGSLRYRTFENGMPAWTTDPNKAIRYARREDAEMAHAEDEDAWRIVEHAWMDPASPPPATVANIPEGWVLVPKELAAYWASNEADNPARLAAAPKPGEGK